MLDATQNSPVMPAVEIDLDLIRRFDQHGPRYTSYPTADRFTEALEIIERAWAERTLSHEGRYWTFADVTVTPRDRKSTRLNSSHT